MKNVVLFMARQERLLQILKWSIKSCSYVPGVILDKGTMDPMSTQNTGFYCSTAGDGSSGLATASRR